MVTGHCLDYRQGNQLNLRNILMKLNLVLATAFIGSRTHNHVDHGGCTTVMKKNILYILPLTIPSGEIPTSVETSVHESFIERTLDWQGKASSHAPLKLGIRDWLVPSALATEVSPPTPDEIKILREAFATFYGMDRDLEKSEQLLSKVVEAWERQGPDEKAASASTIRGSPHCHVLLTLFDWLVMFCFRDYTG
jgi:hypothetical protein